MQQLLLDKAKRHLSRSDPIMKKLIKSYSPFNLDQDKNKRSANHFHNLVSTIISQQLSVKAAQTIRARLIKKQGGRLFNAKKLQLLSDKHIRECGLSKNKIRYTRGICLAVITKQLNFKKMEDYNNDAIIEILIQYPGIGPWSAEMLLMNSYQRLDILPLGDLIIRKSIQNHYNLDKNSLYDNYREIAKPWQPYRSIACRYLWASSIR